MTYNPYPYSMYTPNSYMPYASQAGNYSQPQNNSYASQQPQTGIVWVDGEVGAKAYQLPQGWPANTPIALWDTNDTVIYLKSTNPMGMPNPLQKLCYTMDEQPHGGQSGRTFTQSSAPALMSGDDGRYATKEDLEQIKEEIRKSVTEAMKDKSQQTYTTKGG